MGQSLILWDACSKRDLRAGKHEGISHKTKTLRRSSYGLPDDEYFFLKLIDSSHKGIKLRRHTEFRTDPSFLHEPCWIVLVGLARVRAALLVLADHDLEEDGAFRECRAARREALGIPDVDCARLEAVLEQPGAAVGALARAIPDRHEAHDRAGEPGLRVSPDLPV